MKTIKIITIITLIIGFTCIAMIPTESPIPPETLCSSPNYKITKRGSRYIVSDHGSMTTYFETSSGQTPLQVQAALNSCRAELEDL